MKRCIAVYGAQMVAVRVYFALKKLYPDIQVIQFIVSSKKGNPSSIDSIPVVSLDEFERRDIPILIAAPDEHHEAITAELQKRAFTDYQYMDSQREAALLEQFYRTEGRFTTLKSLKETKRQGAASAPSMAVYMSKFYRDKPLKASFQMPPWMYCIQAGAKLTGTRIAKLQDDAGDNISERNPNYSELTAAYWVGKHGTADYLGLCHYRRILDVTEEDLYNIKAHDIDVILPYPSIHCPNIQEHHRRYLKEEDWQAMLQALKELSPDYEEALPKIFSDSYFYNFNILIAKKEIYREYCNWMFPILARTEELSEPKGTDRADRYIGYLGESLTTLFFLCHEQDYKIVHTGCLMLT